MGSASNVDVVRRAFAAFETRDLRGLVDVCAPDVVFEPQTGRVTRRAEPYRGHDGMRRYLDDVARVWEELRPEPQHFREVDDELVVCTGRVYARGVGRVVDSPAGWLWRVRDGRIVHGRIFGTARAAVEAAEAEASS